jgi:hypothetical protein
MGNQTTTAAMSISTKARIHKAYGRASTVSITPGLISLGPVSTHIAGKVNITAATVNAGAVLNTLRVECRRRHRQGFRLGGGSSMSPFGFATAEALFETFPELSQKTRQTEPTISDGILRTPVAAGKIEDAVTFCAYPRRGARVGGLQTPGRPRPFCRRPCRRAVAAEAWVRSRRRAQAGGTGTRKPRAIPTMPDPSRSRPDGLAVFLYPARNGRFRCRTT